MGAKDSKRACLSYEDAVKRISDADLKRIHETFKRLTGGSSLMSQNLFIQHVLGDGVPLPIASLLYSTCGGTARGIALRDLICGLVLLTKGSADEKIKFLWSLYCNDAGTHIIKTEFMRYLKLEGAEIFSCQSLFATGQDKANFDEFKAFLGHNTSSTVLSRWLLTEQTVSLAGNNLITPTFYQTLAGVTHLEESDICDLEKSFWLLQSTSQSCQLDVTTLGGLISPPVPASAVQGLYSALDVNRDSHIDFKELCCGVSAACRGPIVERVKFCFKIFDLDQDGRLSSPEILHMLEILIFVAKEHNSRLNSTLIFQEDTQTCLDSLESYITVEPTVKTVKFLTQESFLIWGACSTSIIHPFLELLFQICHVSLGLRPKCRHQEKEIVLGWLEREQKRGFRVGDFWYLVSSSWWKNWLQYTTHEFGNTGICAGCGTKLGQLSPPGGDKSVEEGIQCDESFTSNSTDDLGDLLRSNLGDTCSIASSSGVSSSSGSGGASATSSSKGKLTVGPPGPIDNQCLVAEPQFKVQTLTGEGGRLKLDRTLVQHRDFELVPDSLWKALAHWYGGPLPLPRQVIQPCDTNSVDLELYPLNLRILRHQQGQSTQGPTAAVNTWGGVVGGYGAAALSSAGLAGPTSVSPRRYLAHTAAFSKLATVGQVLDFLSQRLSLRCDDLRLWHIKEQTSLFSSGSSSPPSPHGSPQHSSAPLRLLDNEIVTLQDLSVKDGDQILLEVRNADLTWPEELGALVAGAKQQERAPEGAQLPPGATGLHNLGNTCFMNAALQAVSNTQPLTMYFRRDVRLCELNQSNPLGTRGQVARRYSSLLHQLWTSDARSIAPLKLRWCVARHAPHLGGGGQHDSQELLAWLLDALHEDLNRVTGKRYTELSDSGGRPDSEVAAEAWRQHLARDHSVITDLFYGQLKSKVTCQTCGNESVRFDPFNVLSLPLPMDSYTLCEVLVIKLDGSIPIKFGVRLNSESKYSELKERLQRLSGVSAGNLALAEVAEAQIRQILTDFKRVNPSTALDLMAFELEATIVEDAPGQILSAPSPPASPRHTRSQENTPQSRRSIDQPLSALSLHRLSTSGDAAPRRGSVPPTTSPPTVVCSAPRYITAIHRKCVRQDTYFVSQHRTRSVLFGVPLLLAVGPQSTTQELYEAVWTQVGRLLSPVPQSDQTNHATDCDDSLGYEFPFTLRTVTTNGQSCSLCPWTRFCRGCALSCTPTLLSSLLPSSTAPSSVVVPLTCVAIDWEATALHLRYQSSRERSFIEDASVGTCRRQHTEPVDLDHCLRAFTSEESLETRYHCGKCKDKQPATKKLQIWRLPPILIIHLKRFDYVNSKWVKTHKVVNFPFDDFDPTAYLASVPQETILRHRALRNSKFLLASTEEESPAVDGEISPPGAPGGDTPLVTPLKTTKIDLKSSAEDDLPPGEPCASPRPENHEDGAHDFSQIGINSFAEDVEPPWGPSTPPRMENHEDGAHDFPKTRRGRLESTSLLRTPVLDEALEDFHMHHLKEHENPFDLKYQLYAVVSHSGMLNGGHYISYACNPNGSWYCYNDSSCREVRPRNGAHNGVHKNLPIMDTSSAYMLFYERSGLDYAPYLPELSTVGPSGAPPLELDDGDDSDLRKQLCSLQ